MENESQSKRFFMIVITFLAFAASCKLREEKLQEREAWQQLVDSTGNAMLDSIYKLESFRCDSLEKIKVVQLTDSILSCIVPDSLVELQKK